MDKLKSVLADKIIEISSVGGDDVKFHLDKIQRFRDFANACQSFMVKYPAIEDELIKMVNDNDFDTKIASSRVDTIIRLNENSQTNTNIPNIPETKVEVEIEDQPEEEISNLDTATSDALDTIDPIIIEDNINDVSPLPETEDIDFEVIPETDVQEKIYTDFKDIVESDPELEAQKEALLSKKNLNRVIQVCGIILIIIVLIFVIKFVKENWQLVLYVLGGLAIAALLIWYFVRKKKNKE